MKHELDTAKKIIEYLDDGIATLDDATVGKLAEARKSAVRRMENQVHVSAGELAHAGLEHRIGQHLHGRQGWMTMLATLMLILMLVALVHKNTTVEPVEADALLLASDLPPEAYVDKGFDAWLENSSQP